MLEKLKSARIDLPLSVSVLLALVLYGGVSGAAYWFGSSREWQLPQDALLVGGALAVVVAVVVSYRKQDVEESGSRLAKEQWEQNRTIQDNKEAREKEQWEQNRTIQDNKEAREKELLDLERTTRDRTARSDQFARSVEMLGSDRPNVRMAGAYALAAVADQWEDLRQTTVDVLCGYLRLPYGPSSPDAEQQAQEREVRLAIISIIQEHLRNPDSKTNWCKRRFDFRGAYFDGGDFSDSSFFGERVNFDLCTFEPTTSPIWFDRMKVGREGSNTHMSFDSAELSSSVEFNNIRIAEGSRLRFTRAKTRSGSLPIIRVAGPDDAQRIEDWSGLTFGTGGNSR